MVSLYWFTRDLRLHDNAALLAARSSDTEVGMHHILEAIEIQRMGEADENQKLASPEDRRRVAVHEAGHALVGALLNTGRVEKVTILPMLLHRKFGIAAGIFIFI